MRERERKINLPPAGSPPPSPLPANGAVAVGLGQVEARKQKLCAISHMVVGVQTLRLSFVAFSQAVNRQLDGKWISQDTT